MKRTLHSEITNERELLTRASKRDAVAFGRLVDPHLARLLRCARQWSPDVGLAEDLVQETLMEAWRCLDRFEPDRCRLITWLESILYHRFLKALRRMKSRLPASPESDSTFALIEPVAPLSEVPSHAAESREIHTALRLAVASLPDGQREVVQMRFFSDASLEEISAALRISLGTVKSRLHHALEKLRSKPDVMSLLRSADSQMAHATV